MTWYQEQLLKDLSRNPICQGPNRNEQAMGKMSEVPKSPCTLSLHCKTPAAAEECRTQTAAVLSLGMPDPSEPLHAPHTTFLPLRSFRSSVLLNRVFSLALFLAQELADPRERIARDDQAGGDDGLAASYHAIPAALLILLAPGAEHVVAAAGRGDEWGVHVGEDGVLDAGRLLLDDGKARVDLGQARVGQLIGAAHVRRGIGEGLLRVRRSQHRLHQALVGAGGHADGFLAVRIRLDCGDGVRDDRVGSEVLSGGQLE